MSGYLQGRVWFQDVRGSERDVLLAMADHAHDDGTAIYPSMDYLAWKVGLTRRRVQQIVSSLRERGVLIVVEEATRYSPTHYRMDLSPLPEKPERPGAKISAPLSIRDEIQRPAGVKSRASRDEIQTSSEPSGEPSREPSRQNGRPRPVSYRGKRVPPQMVAEAEQLLSVFCEVTGRRVSGRTRVGDPSAELKQIIGALQERGASVAEWESGIRAFAANPPEWVKPPWQIGTMFGGKSGSWVIAAGQQNSAAGSVTVRNARRTDYDQFVIREDDES